MTNETSPCLTLRERIIVIDPGHGGKYPGAVGPADIHERDVVLEIGKFLQNMLEGRGAEVIMTRTQDENVDLYERIDSALEHNADLFISNPCQCPCRRCGRHQISRAYDTLQLCSQSGTGQDHA